MFTRRHFLTRSAAGVAALSFVDRANAAPVDSLIDVHAYLGRWPFRRLAGDDTASMSVNLRAAGVSQAWVGSFEALLHKDLAGVNQRLAETCRRDGHGLLVPIGAINPRLPDWEDDFRRCDEVHGMPGVRLHPDYHNYSLDDASFARLLALAAQRTLIVQLVCATERPRRPYFGLKVETVDLAPLVEQLRTTAAVKLILLNHDGPPRQHALRDLATLPNVYFDAPRQGDGLGVLADAIDANRIVFGSGAPSREVDSARRAMKTVGLNLAQTHAAAQQLLNAAMPGD